jgi:hypothetical protein
MTRGRTGGTPDDGKQKDKHHERDAMRHGSVS